MVPVEDSIAADDGEIFGLSLGDEHAVEGVFVDARQHSGSLGVLQADGEVAETPLTTCRDEIDYGIPHA